MSYIIKSKTTEKFLPRLVAMSASDVYLNQVRGAIDTIRAQQNGLSYLAPQMGGLSGQRQVIENVLVLQTIDFEVD